MFKEPNDISEPFKVKHAEYQQHEAGDQEEFERISLIKSGFGFHRLSNYSIPCFTNEYYSAFEQKNRMVCNDYSIDRKFIFG